MKVKMIGTGSLSVKERSSCCLIDEKILVDCGNGILKTLLEQGVDISKIDTLLITHLHGDHYLDLPFLIMQRNFLSVPNKLKIYCPVGTEKAVNQLSHLMFPDMTNWKQRVEKSNIEYVEFDFLNNESLGNDYLVTSFDVIHGNCFPAYGFVISHNGKSLGLSGDSIYCENINKILELSDIVILDMSFVDSNNKHMGVNDIELLAQKFNKKIIPTHMTLSARQYALEKKINNVIVLDDGELIEF